MSGVTKQQRTGYLSVSVDPDGVVTLDGKDPETGEPFSVSMTATGASMVAAAILGARAGGGGQRVDLVPPHRTGSLW